MIIGVDIRVLASPTKSGVEEYTENILSCLFSLDRNIQFKLFYSSRSRPLSYYPWRTAENVKIYELKTPNLFLFTSSRLFHRPYLDKILGGVDVFFSPHFFLSSLSPRCRRVNTFHDLSFERFPEFFSTRRNSWHWLMQPLRQANYSDRVIAVSESTRADLVSLYNIDSAKIDVIYSGTEPINIPAAGVLKFKKEKDLPERYILSLGKLEPRKNVAGLVRAFNLLKQKPGHEDVALIIVGDRGWLDENIFEEVSRSPYHKQIRWPGYAEAERPYYYRSASVLAYSSFFEGFGLPVLEAMSYGCPVVASNNSSLPEVAGDAALMIDPYSPQAIAKAVSDILNDDALAERLSKKGLNRAKTFTWQSCAEKTLETLIRAAG